MIEHPVPIHIGLLMAGRRRFALVCACAFFTAAGWGRGGLAQEQVVPSLATATGFSVSESGFVVTAWHAVRDRERIWVGPAFGRPMKRATLVGHDAEHDLAILKVDLTLPALVISEYAALPSGTEASVIGFPSPRALGPDAKITQGLVNGDAPPGRSNQKRSNRFQLSAEIHKGNSGGPVLGPDGAVIGIVVSKLDALKAAEKIKDLPQNVNFAVKTAPLLALLKKHEIPHEQRRLAFAPLLRPLELFTLARSSVVAIATRSNLTASPSKGDESDVPPLNE